MVSMHGDPAAEIGSEEQGGQPIYIKNISRLLSDEYKIDIFTRKKKESENTVINLFPEVNVVRIEAGPVEFVPKKELYTHINEFFMGVVRWGEEHDERYSLIHSHYWYSGIVALKLRDALEVPVVHNCHSLGRIKYEMLDKEKPPYADMRLLEEEVILKRANGIVASTPQEVKNILDLYDVSGENIRLIRAGVNKDLFRPIDKEKAIEKIEIDFENVLLFVGRITRAKGLSILIKALKKVKKRFDEEVKLLVVGGDVSGVMHSEEEERQKRKLKKMLTELGLNDDVKFLGPVEREKLPYYYALAEVCVVPSRYETFGLVAVEAMACGLPVVASKVGGLEHTIEHGVSGLHFVPGRADSLAESILNILKNSQKLKEMRINARKRAARNFSLERTTKQIKELYDSLIF